MGDNFHGLAPDTNEEAIEQDEMKTKLDLISVTSARNLDAMQVAINTNTAVTTTHSANFDMTNTNTLGTYAQANRTLINTNASNISTNTTNINNIQSGLFDNMTYFIMNSPQYFAMSGGSHGGAVTGSVLSSQTLGTAPLRFVINSLGIAQDTFSPNNFSFSESGTKVTFGWTEINVLVFYKMEYYDNSSGNKTLNFGMYDDYHNSQKFSIRTDVYFDSSSFRFTQISGFAGTIAIQNYANYYFWASSPNGGKLQGVQFFLVNATKAF